MLRVLAAFRMAGRFGLLVVVLLNDEVLGLDSVLKDVAGVNEGRCDAREGLFSRLLDILIAENPYGLLGSLRLRWVGGDTYAGHSSDKVLQLGLGHVLRGGEGKLRVGFVGQRLLLLRVEHQWTSWGSLYVGFVVAFHGVVVRAGSLASRRRAPPTRCDIVRLLDDRVSGALPLNYSAAEGARNVARVLQGEGTLLTHDVTTHVDLYHSERQLARANEAIEVVPITEVRRQDDWRNWNRKALDLSSFNGNSLAHQIHGELIATGFGWDILGPPLVASANELVAHELSLPDESRGVDHPSLQVWSLGEVGDGIHIKIDEGHRKGNLGNFFDLDGLRTELLETQVVQSTHERHGRLILDGINHLRCEDVRPHCELTMRIVNFDLQGLAVELDGSLTTESFTQTLFAFFHGDPRIRELRDGFFLGQFAPWPACRNFLTLANVQPGVGSGKRDLVLQEDIGEVIARCLHEHVADDIVFDRINLAADGFLELANFILQSVELSLKHPIAEDVEHAAGELGGSTGQFVLDELSRQLIGDHGLVHHFSVDVRLLETVGIYLGVHRCTDRGLGTILLQESHQVVCADFVRKSNALLDSQALEGVVGGYSSLNHLKVGWV
jgi:hypothetical protein